MTQKEINVFNEYQSIIVDVVDSVCCLMASIKEIGNREIDDFSSTLLSKAPGVLIEKGMVGKPAGEVRAYLLVFFKNDLRNAYRKQSRMIKRSASVESMDELACEAPPEFCESSEQLAKKAVATLLARCPLEVKQLCEVYMNHGSFDAAIQQLGWSKGKVYRTKQAAEAFFRKNCKSCGGFFEVGDIWE